MIQPLPYALEITRFLERHHYERVVPKAALIDMDGTLYDSMPNFMKVRPGRLLSTSFFSEPTTGMLLLKRLRSFIA